MSAHRFVLGLVRVSAAAVVLLVGGLGIYGFGAGYFYNIDVGPVRLGLPTPWNVVAVVLLSTALLAAVRRILLSPTPEGRTTVTESWR